MPYSTQTKNILEKLNTLITNGRVLEVESFKELAEKLPSEVQDKVNAAVIFDEGWLFGGADFNSLEDYISALTTKDPQKLKVYEQGFDGHNLRAFNYFPDMMVSIKKKMDELLIDQRFFKLINDSGEIEYVSERELNSRNIEIPT